MRRCSSSTRSSVVRVAASQRVELAPVDVERVAVAFDAARVGVADRCQRPGEDVHRRLDGGVVARAHHGAVEHRVGPHHARPLAEMTLEQVDRALELGQVGCRSRARAPRAQRPARARGGRAARRPPRPPRPRPRSTGPPPAPGRSRRTMPPPLPRRTGTRPESSSTRSAWRSVGFEIPSATRQLGLARETVAAPQLRALDRLGEMLDRGFERSRRADRLDRERLLDGGHPLSLSPLRLDSKRETLFHFKCPVSAPPQHPTIRASAA